LVAGVARVSRSTPLGEAVKLDKQIWSVEEFTVSIILGVENGAINSPFSVVVDAFRDADGGGALKTSTCKAYGNETLPPTEAPTMRSYAGITCSYACAQRTARRARLAAALSSSRASQRR
jgi:hypothetical protein